MMAWLEFPITISWEFTGKKKKNERVGGGRLAGQEGQAGVGLGGGVSCPGGTGQGGHLKTKS